MPTQPSGGRRDLERRAADVLDPENRPESAGHLPTRRKVLSMVTGGIAATAAVGTVSASKRPTVTASSTTCGVIDLEYTDRGPTVSVDITGDGLEEPYSVTLEPGGSDDVRAAPGRYFVEAQPAKANGGSSVPVDGSTVHVDGCGGVGAILTSCSRLGVIELKNKLDSCVRVEKFDLIGGWPAGDRTFVLGPGETAMSKIDFSDHDEWIYEAYGPPASGDCIQATGDAVPINGVDSPLHLTGTDCASLTEESGALERP